LSSCADGVARGCAERAALERGVLYGVSRALVPRSAPNQFQSGVKKKRQANSFYPFY